MSLSFESFTTLGKFESFVQTKANKDTLHALVTYPKANITWSSTPMR